MPAKKLGRYLLVFCGLAAGEAAAEEWYDKLQWACDDVLVLRNEFLVRDLVPSSSRFLNNRGSYFVAEISRNAITTGEIEVGKPFINYRKALSSADVQHFYSVLTRRQDAITLPWFTSHLLPSSTYMKSIVFDKAIKFITKIAIQENNKAVSGVDNIKIFLAKGGEIVAISILSELDKQFVLTQNIEYVVKLGDENRHFLLISCPYPAYIRPSKITITYKNDSKTSFVEITPERWVKKTASGIDDGELIVLSNDEQFIVFEDVDTCNEATKKEGLCTLFRVKKAGGPVDVKYNTDSEWNVSLGGAWAPDGRLD